MGELEDMQRDVAVDTYRGMAFRMRIQAGLLTANADALESAAERIASGEAEVNTLRLVEEREEPEPEDRASDEEVAKARWRTRKGRALEAVVQAAYEPAHNIEAAGAFRLMQAAGFDPDAETEFHDALQELVEARLIELHRVENPSRGGLPYNVFIPTPAGFEETGAEFPPDDSAATTLFEHFGGVATREMTAVADGAEAGDH